MATTLDTALDGVGSVLNTAVGTGGTLGSEIAGLPELNIKLGFLTALKLSFSGGTIAIDGLDQAIEDVTDTLLATPLVDPNGIVSISLENGMVSVNLAKVVAGGDLNGLPANTEVLDAVTLGKISAAVTDVLGTLTGKVTTAVTNLVNDLSVTITLPVELTAVGVSALNETITVKAQLGQLTGSLAGSPTVEITNENPSVLGLLTNTLLEPVTDLLTSATGNVTGVLNPVVTNTVTALGPVLTTLKGLLTINVNEQQSGDLGTSSTTMRALAITLVPTESGGVAKVDLASSTVKHKFDATPPGSANSNASALAAASASANTSGKTNTAATAAAQAAAMAVYSTSAQALATTNANAAGKSAALTNASTNASNNATSSANSSAQAAATASQNSQPNSASNAKGTAQADANASASSKAAAQATASTNASSDAAGSTGGTSTSSTNTNTNTSTNANAQADANVNASASASADSNASGTASQSAAANAAAAVAANASASSNASGTPTPPNPGKCDVKTPRVDSPFLDVATSHKFYPEIDWMHCTKLSTRWKVTGGHEYRPSADMTREAMAAFIFRMNAPTNYTPKPSKFIDVNSSTKFYREISWMGEEGLSTGYWTPAGVEYRPKNTLSREAMAAFIERLIDDYWNKVIPQK